MTVAGRPAAPGDPVTVILTGTAARDSAGAGIVLPGGTWWPLPRGAVTVSLDGLRDAFN